jgi:hypothetical protein
MFSMAAVNNCALAKQSMPLPMMMMVMMMTLGEVGRVELSFSALPVLVMLDEKVSELKTIGESLDRQESSSKSHRNNVFLTPSLHFLCCSERFLEIYMKIMNEKFWFCVERCSTTN